MKMNVKAMFDSARARASLGACAAALSLVALTACGASRTAPTKVASADHGRSSDAEDLRDVRAIHRSRCGNCHVRVEPGTRTRAQLDAAFTRHHKRVRMNDREWSGMVDYLAADGGGMQAASNGPQASKQ